MSCLKNVKSQSDHLHFCTLCVTAIINHCLSAAVFVAPEGGSLEWNKCWATVRWLTRATTTRTSPATLLLPSSTRWLMPSSLHQPTNLSSCLPNNHVSRFTKAAVVLRVFMAKCERYVLKKQRFFYMFSRSNDHLKSSSNSGRLRGKPVRVRELRVRQRRWKRWLRGRDQSIVPVSTGVVWTAQCQSHDPTDISHHAGQQ